MRGIKLKVLQFITVIFGVVLDRVTKALAVKYLVPIRDFPIIRGVFHLTYAENTGAGFSILEGNRLFLIVIPIIVAAFLVYMLLSKKVTSRLFSWSLALVLSGAVGNLIDRIFSGYVVDMFNFTLINFPIFNVADIFVTVGAVLLFIYIIFFCEKAEKKDE